MKPACPKCGGSLDSDRHRYCALNPITERKPGRSKLVYDKSKRTIFAVTPDGGAVPWLDQATDKVLAHKPKPKSSPARKRARRAKKIAQAGTVVK
jgi:hypothetical protein